MEEINNYHIGKFQYEELDNGAVVRDIEEGWAKAALYKGERGKDKDDVIMQIGDFIYNDLRAFQDRELTNKVKITVKFEKAE